VKCAIVKSSALARLKTWSVERFLYDTQDLDRTEENARKQIAEAEQRIEKYRVERAKRKAFHDELVRSGDVVIIGKQE
jgi:hypothetical protein